MDSFLRFYIKHPNWTKGICISIFIFLIFSAITAGILRSEVNAGDWLTAYITFYLAIATIILAITTAFVIIWQGQQLKIQLELQVMTTLYTEWNEMSKERCKLCSIIPSILQIEDEIVTINDNTLDIVEDVIEFLEKIASYYQNCVLTRTLIWDTFGFYIMRYYFYTRCAINSIRKKWSNDKTLYKDLDKLYIVLMEEEVRLRKKKNKKEIEDCFIEELEKFIKSECYANS